MATNSIGQSKPNIPARPLGYVDPGKKAAQQGSNFQTVSGQYKSVPMPTRTPTQVFSPFQTLGMQAKDPAQNIPKPNNNLATGQVKTISTPPTNTTSKAVDPWVGKQGQTWTSDSDGNPQSQIGGANSSGTLNPNYNSQPGVTQGSGNQDFGTNSGMFKAAVADGALPPPVNTQGKATTPSPYTAPSNSGIYGKLITDAANRSTQPGQQYTDAYNMLQKDKDALRQMQFNEAEDIKRNRVDRIPYGQQSGLESAIRNQALMQQTAMGNQLSSDVAGLGAANTQQGLLQALLSGATGAAATTLQGGQYMPFGGDGMGFGAGLERQRQVDIYNSNTQQGIDYGREAGQLDQPMQALGLLGGTFSNYLKAKGLNTNTAVMANSLVNSGLQQTDPAAYKIIKDMGNQAQGLVAQIAGINSSLIPSDITDKARSMNVENMSPQDILTFVEAANIAAQPRYSSLKSSSSASFGSGYQPYSGQTAADPYAQIPATPTPQNSIGGLPNTSNSVINAGIGAIQQYGKYIIPALGTALGWFFGGPIGGVAGGLAGQGVQSGIGSFLAPK